MISHILNEMILLQIRKTKKTNDDDEYKEDTSKHQDVNECVDNHETSDTLRNKIDINTKKEEEPLIKRLMTMNFKPHVIQYVIYIISLCGGEMI